MVNDKVGGSTRYGDIEGAPTADDDGYAAKEPQLDEDWHGETRLLAKDDISGHGRERVQHGVLDDETEYQQMLTNMMLADENQEHIEQQYTNRIIETEESESESESDEIIIQEESDEDSDMDLDSDEDE
jgi:hypothetical protein